jgi:DNA-binding NarL/FixJ family response regulator
MGMVSALRVVMPEADVSGAGTAEEGVAALDASPDIDLVLIDLRLPGMDGLAALAIYGERHPGVPRVLISGEDDERLVHKAFDAGASGFIPKSLPMDAVAAAIRQVLDGGVFVPTASPLPPAAAGSALTLRQLEVLRLLGEGYTNKEIAQSLEITERTARAHVAAILQSLEVDNRTHAVVAAQRLGWLPRPA